MSEQQTETQTQTQTETQSPPQTKKQKVENQFDKLKDVTTIVADTGDIDAIRKFKPEDATTNPSLIYKAATMSAYQSLVDDAIAYGKGKGKDTKGDVSTVMDKLAVNFGVEITKIVPGYVSTEVDARLSFDTESTIAKARQIIQLYKEAGVDKERILIKIAATWEGIKAAEVLEKEDGITCNLTLIFSKAQAIACAEANITLISPFVGRIMDWHKKESGVSGYDDPSDDPGVISVTAIYNYYKKFGYETIVMGASFRNVGEIIELAGCDRLTISPSLLETLTSCTDEVVQKLDATKSKAMDDIEKIDMDEKTFRWMMNEDAMATEKLAQGIRNFAIDIVKLEDIVKSKMSK
jgi:transaldolase